MVRGSVFKGKGFPAHRGLPGRDFGVSGKPDLV